MVSQLLRESIRQARETPTLHADSEIAALHVARADALGEPSDPCAGYAYYVTGRVAAGRIRARLAVEYSDDEEGREAEERDRKLNEEIDPEIS